jgi:hypothetical protein
MPVRAQPFTFQFTAWNTSTNRGQTGDAAHLTLRATGDGAEFAPSASPTEVDATGLPGLYSIALTGAEMNYGSITVAGARPQPPTSLSFPLPTSRTSWRLQRPRFTEPMEVCW